MATITDLGRQVKAKYPGAYDDMDDIAVGQAVKAKFPGSYDDFREGPELAPSHGPPEKIAPQESLVRGGLQGASFGFGDEAAAAVDAALPGVSRWFNKDPLAAAPEGAGFRERYKTARDYYRGRNVSAEKEHPGTYLASQVAGAVAPALAGGAPLTGAKGLIAAAGQGAATGAGYSEADEGLGLASDIALGGALGTAGYGAGKVLGKALAKARGGASRLLDMARARAGAQASKETAEQLGSVAGKVGGEVQKGSRYVENLMRLEASMTPEQRALYAQLQQSGVVPKLQQSVAQSTMESLPGQAGTIAARKAELAALQEAAPEIVKSRTAELLNPQVGKDVKSFAKGWLEPIAWAYGANKAGELAGMDPGDRAVLTGAAGIIGGRTRAGKALYARLKRPGNQAKLAKALQRAASEKNARVLARALGGSAPLLAIEGEEDR
ncbi:MAG: hypothetical protein WAV13_03950 [Thermodesulfovibrionales bacterium]